MGTHHHDGGLSTPPGPVRGRRALIAVVVLLALATAVGMVLLRPGADRLQPDVADRGERVKGTVTAVQEVACSDGPDPSTPPVDAPVEGPPCRRVEVRLDDGPERGRTVQQVYGPPYTLTASVGQGVVLSRSRLPDVAFEQRYQVLDEQRGGVLAVLALVFGLAVVALGRWRGAASLVGLGVSLVVLVGWLVPALLAQRPPLLTALVGASAVMLSVLLLTHGPSVRTATATVGTALSLCLTVALAAGFVELAGLTGLTSDEAFYVAATFPDVDVRGLLLAGIVVGALGILDDVTVTQVSTVWELRAADASMPARQLYAAALRVGRDHIASTVNTLLLAYAGAALPLLVVFSTSGEGLVATLTNGVVAQEVVRALAGSVGLVAAVPLTTALAAAMCPPTEVAGPGREPSRQVKTAGRSAGLWDDWRQDP